MPKQAMLYFLLEKNEQEVFRVTEIVGGFTAFGRRKQRAEGQSHYDEESLQPAEREPYQFDPEKLKEIADRDRRWAWAQVDLGAIRNNCVQAKHRVGGLKRMMAVVSADACGHGAPRVAKTALNAGADCLGVATIDEAIALREALINAPILLMTQPPASAIQLLLAYKVMPAIQSSEFAIQYAEAADSLGLMAPYHLSVNTGTNCTGLRYDQVCQFMMQVGFHRALDLQGVFTTLATAEGPENMDLQMQATRFVDAVNAMAAAGFKPGIVHCADTAALVRYPELHFDMARLDVGLYGYHPCVQTRGLIDLRPAMTICARITDVNNVPLGEGVGAGLTYRSVGSSKICTIPLGFADGLPRMLSGRLQVMYSGQLMRQVGTIGMDQCSFEVDLRTRVGRPRLDPQVGDEVVLVGRQGDAHIDMEELADEASLAPTEMCCHLGARLSRVYV